MYKVFVNNRPLKISDCADDSEKNIPYINESDLDVAVHLLNSKDTQVNVYGEKPDQIWDTFCAKNKCIYAAGGLVKNEKNEILFIYRMEKWDLPKGKMEKGEDKKSTALREVEEECGISGLRITKDLPDTYHIYYDKETILKFTHWFEMSYHGTEKLVPQTEEGITKVEWIGENRINEVLSNTYPNIENLVKFSLSQSNF